MYGTGAWADTRIELNLAKGVFVVHQILLQDGMQCFGLLWAQVNALKVTHLHASFILLLKSAKHQKKVPDIDPYLDAVGVGLTIIRCSGQLNCRLRRILHHDLESMTDRQLPDNRLMTGGFS